MAFQRQRFRQQKESKIVIAVCTLCGVTVVTVAPRRVDRRNIMRLSKDKKYEGVSLKIIRCPWKFERALACVNIRPLV